MARVEPRPTRVPLPDPAHAPPGNDLIAAGASIDPALMLAGYRRGLFAMPIADDLIGWFSPDPRGVLPLDQLHVSRSLRRSLRRYSVTVNTDFAAVLAGCADRTRPGHWIAPEFADCYLELHRMGWAHSIEVRESDGKLAGGLVGVEVGGLFSGESMYHHGRDASKVAVVELVRRLAAAPGPRLFDVQWSTDHLRTLGVVDWSRDSYLTERRAALMSPASFA